MRAAQFVHELAQKLCIPEAEVAAYDRYLANAGLRAKAEGRDYPDLTTKEAIRLPLALMCARTPARAAADLADVERFRLLAHRISTAAGNPANLKKVLGLSVAEIERMDLIDVLTVSVQAVAAPWGSAFHGPMVGIEVHLGGPVMLQVFGDGFVGDLTFVGAMDIMAEVGKPLTSTEFSRSATVGPGVMAWIGHVAPSNESAEA